MGTLAGLAQRRVVAAQFLPIADGAQVRAHESRGATRHLMVQGFLHGAVRRTVVSLDGAESHARAHAQTVRFERLTGARAAEHEDPIFAKP